MTILVGADGCRGGWLCVVATESRVESLVAPDLASLLYRLPRPAIVAIDIPIGLPERGARGCDIEARALLKAPRASSVFPAPVRATLAARNYEEARQLHRTADGRGLSKQAFAILPKIREVDACMRREAGLQDWIFEVHPEVCFTAWNGGTPMKANKSKPEGRAEREALIEAKWPGLRTSLAAALDDHDWGPDDLNDALAASWTAERILAGTATRLPTVPESDGRGIRMAMWA